MLCCDYYGPNFLSEGPADAREERLEPEFENSHFTEMCSGSQAGSYLRLIDFVYHSTVGLRVIKKKRSTSQQQRLSFRYRTETPPS